MKKALKVTALFFSSAFLLAACGQDKKEETTVATTTQATTATPTTTYTLEDANKAVFEIKDLIGKGFEYKSEHNNDFFTVTYSFDYTKIDMKKLKEIEPNLRLTDDNTVSYSDFRDKLLKAGYVEK